MKKSMLVACLAGVMMASLVRVGSAADSDVIREMKDRAEIEQLMWRYARALDTFDIEAYVQTYAPDGTFGAGKDAVSGPAALRKVVMDLKKRHDDEEKKTGQKHGRMHHIMTNTTLEFIDKDHARLNYYWIQVYEAPSEGQQPRVASAGRGIDDLTRVNGRWLIQRRNVTPDG